VVFFISLFFILFYLVLGFWLWFDLFLFCLFVFGFFFVFVLFFFFFFCFVRSVLGLDHAFQQSIDEVLPVSCISSLDEVGALVVEPSAGVGKLEGPQEAVGNGEVGAGGEDLVDQILDADDPELAQLLLDLDVVEDGGPGAVDLEEASLVDELLDGREVGVSPGNVGLDDLEHGKGGLVQPHEHGVVDLTEAQQLKDLPGLGADTEYTTDSGHHGNLGLSLNKEVALFLGLSDSLHLVLALGSVLLHVLLSTYEVLGASPGVFLGDMDLGLVLRLLLGLVKSEPLADDLGHFFLLGRSSGFASPQLALLVS